MPCLSSLVGRGVAGDLTSYAPYLSPMLWTTIATGHHPDRHGVHGFAELDPATGAGRAIGTITRRKKALWNIISEQGGDVGVVGWMGTFPAEAIRVAFISDTFGHAPDKPEEDWPVVAGAVYPPALGEELADLRLRPQDVDTGLLGLFIPKLLDQRRPNDPRPQRLRQRLAQLYTLHNACVALVSNKQPDFLAVYFHFLDLVCHEFVMFHPPRHSGVGTTDYELYREVVAGAYRVQDALLGDLLKHCHPETRVMLVSDHGFTTGAGRPVHTPRNDAGLAAWHRREGLIVACGPGVAKGRALGVVRPQDIAPTLLAWRGLPAADDMPGRVIAELFDEVPRTHTIPSWETEPAKTSAPLTPAAEPEPDERSRLTRRFVELGYLDPAAQAGPVGGARVEDENRFSLGTALRDLGRAADALPHLQFALLSDLESTTRATELTLCLLDLGLVDEAEQTAAAFFDHEQETPRALFLRAQLLVARRAFKEVQPLLARLEQTDFAPEAGGLRRLILLRGGHWEAAREAFRQQIERTPSRVTAHLGLAEACMGGGRTTEAITAARRAVELDPGSQAARDLLVKVRGKQTNAARPLSMGWDAMAGVAQARVELRAAYRERERFFLEVRQARRLAEASERAKARPPVVVISGAPRSGTSMMMRMLAQAGLPVLTDGVRESDASNPLGYFEWEAAKQLAALPKEIARAEGKAVKVVSPLLASLPAGWRYDVVFMRRNADSILRSQERMLENARKAEGAAPARDTRVTTPELLEHIEQTLAWARSQPNIRLVELDYDELLDRPEPALARLVAFIGEKRFKRVAALRLAIRADLRHHATASPKPDDTNLSP